MEVKLDFDDVLIVPKSSTTASRSAVNLEREFKFYNSISTWRGIPIIAANMDAVGTFDMGVSLSEYKMVTCLHKHYSKEELISFFNKNTHLLDYIWYSTGITDTDIEKLKDVLKGIYEQNPFLHLNICIDVANGYTNHFNDRVREIRNIVGPYSIIMAGNICTYDRVHVLLDAGADIIKVGIGPGSACETRKVTGVGYPQLSAVMECADAAHGKKTNEKRLGLVCSDGGCRTPGDVCKGFGVGNADFVMLGGMLAGTSECEGEWEYEFNKNGYRHTTNLDSYQVEDKDFINFLCKNGGSVYIPNSSYVMNQVPSVTFPTYSQVKKSLKFYGMSSYEAQEKYGGIKDYTASEGSVNYVPYKGDVSVVLKEIMGGLRSCCAYIGATCLKDMAKCTSYVRVSR